jgi:ankyrin repeat protein
VLDSNVATVKALLAHGANVAARDSLGRSALHLLGDLATAELVEVLLAAGAKFHACDGEGRTAFGLALEAERTGVLRALAAAYLPRDDDAPDESGWTEAHHAACFGSPRGIEKLLAAGTLAAPDAQGWSVLHQASFDGVTSAIERLVAAGLSVEHLSSGGERPLHVATSEDAVRTLISLGADVRAVDAQGNTALHLAVVRSFPWLLPLLTAAGASWDAKNAAGETPRALAAARGMP